jgi:menaquinol-cytochrome c reductase cytochrome b/c subunit
VNEKNKFETGFASDAKKDPRRIVFLTKRTSAKVTGEAGPRLMTYPHLLLREALVFQALMIGMVIAALFWDAPLEQLANPLLTPNPAKAPWYFLGLQELLHYFPPLMAGIIIPTLVVIGLVVIPYFNVNVQGRPLWSENARQRFVIFLGVVIVLTLCLVLFHAWTVLIPTILIAGLMAASYAAAPGRKHWRNVLKGRPISWWVMTWFIVVALVLTVVGTFFRGPGWSWIWPWRPHAG